MKDVQNLYANEEKVKRLRKFKICDILLEYVLSLQFWIKWRIKKLKTNNVKKVIKKNHNKHGKLKNPYDCNYIHCQWIFSYTFSEKENSLTYFQ